LSFLSTNNSVQLEDVEKAAKALKGLLEIAEDQNAIQNRVDDYWNILDLSKHQMEETSQGFESAARKEFERIGILGSAIRPNLKENESTKSLLADMRRSFEPELENLRNAMMQELGME
jgi:hypothetical protein